MHSFHAMSKEDAFWTSLSEQFFEIGIDPFSFSLRILAFSRMFTKYVTIHKKKGTFPFFCQCSKIPLRHGRKIANHPQISERKTNSQKRKGVCVLQYLLNGGTY